MDLSGQAATGNTRNLLFGSGDPGAALSVSRGLSQDVAQSGNSASKNFGLKLTELLQQYQQMGTKPFIEQGLNAQEAQIKRVQSTPSDLIGAAPGVQAGVRDASVQALQPTVQSAQNSAQTFGEQLKSFGGTIESARQLIRDEEESANKRRDDAANLIDKSFDQFGGDAFVGADEKEIARLEKLAGYPAGWIKRRGKTLKEKEIEDKRLDTDSKITYSIQDVNGRTVRFGFGPDGEVVSEIDLGPVASETKPLSAEAAKVKAIAETMIPEISQLKQKFQNDYKGTLRGYLTGTDREVVKLVDQIADKVGRLRSGGAINKDEEDRFKRQLGSWGDLVFGKSDQAAAALDGLSSEAQNVLDSIIPQAQATSNTGGSGKFSTTAPNGKTYTFPSQEALNQFLNETMGTNFNTSQSLKGNSSVDRIATAIGQYESGGNYRAKGPETSSGDRAYGKYQVMGANIPSWTKAALGKSLTPAQFLADPKAQDAVAKWKMGQYLQQFGTVENVAIAWFAGPGAVGKNNTKKKDVIGTSVPKYVQNIRAIYDRIG